MNREKLPKTGPFRTGIHGVARFADALLATNTPAAAPDSSSYANLIAETLPTRVRGDFAKERFVAATAAAA